MKYKFFFLGMAALAMAGLLGGCEKVIVNPVEEEDSSSEPAVLLEDVARLLSVLPLESEQLEEVYDAARASATNGYDEEYRMQERGLSFYAGKLFLTPKYLSKLIKNVSGRSAHEWIDSFVILEAKNRLKYSDRPIKQIVSELNFPNQTTFYRFFKIQTGMTPTEYRKS